MMLEQRRDIDDELRDLIKGPVRVVILDMVERELQHLGLNARAPPSAWDKWKSSGEQSQQLQGQFSQY